MPHKIKQFEFESTNGDKYTFEIDDTSFFLYTTDDDDKKIIAALFEREDIPFLVNMLLDIQDV